MAKAFLLSALILLGVTGAAIAQDDDKGAMLYQKHCVACHGEDGSGNGPAAKDLSPAPANLRLALKDKIVSDEYLLWTIREGGVNVHTDMPSFEQSEDLDQDDAKAIVKYLWAAFK